MFSVECGPANFRDMVMLNRAIGAAAVSEIRHQHGAVVYKSGRVLAAGINRMRNEHPTMEMDPLDYMVHAEVTALHRLTQKNIKGSTVYVARVNRKGDSMFSKPCRECLDYMFQRGVKRIVHS